MSLDPDLHCSYCGSANLIEDATYPCDEEIDIDIYCGQCNRRILL